MSRTFKLKAFLRNVEGEYLDRYIQENIKINPLEINSLETGFIEAWENFIEELPSDQRSSLEADFTDINDLSTETGIALLLDCAEQNNVYPQESLESISGEHNKAFFFFLNHKNVFDQTLQYSHIAEIKPKAVRIGLKQVPIIKLKDRAQILADALSSFFKKKDGRGRNCVVEPYLKNNQIYFLAYPEDHSKTTLTFQTKKLKRLNYRPAFEIAFLYSPENGRLVLNTKGGAKRERLLFNIFNSVVLQDEKPIPDNQNVFNLEKFLDPAFSFHTDLKDNIEYVALSQLKLSNKFSRHRITLEVPRATGIIHLQALIKKHHISADSYNVTQANLKVKFADGKKRGAVTVQLSYPDKCSLNDSPQHLIIKKYLELWGLEGESPNNKINPSVDAIEPPIPV